MEWQPETLRDYKAFIDGNKGVKDAIERALLDIEQALQKAWTNNRCLTCPIAELTAIAAATLQFYRENRNAKARTV